MININCDLGEGLNNEHIIMPLINSCNIACGGHAGNNESMIECVEIATRNNLQIGAHPSYPDRLNFGRKKIEAYSYIIVYGKYAFILLPEGI